MDIFIYGKVNLSSSNYENKPFKKNKELNEKGRTKTIPKMVEKTRRR